MSAPLPLAVLGGGLIGARHALAAHDCAVTRLTAVVEPDADRRAALYAQGYPVVEQIAEVPADTRAAIVATPTQAHHTHTYECLSRGWAVIVEKPIAATLDAARAILDMGGNKGQNTTGSTPIFVGHHRRCHPFVASAQAQIRALGDPVAVQALWALRKDTPYFNADWRRAPGGGPIMINLIHEIDLLQVWLGPIAEVSALVSSARRGHAVEDTAAFALRFDSGAMGSVILSDAGASPWSFEAATGENPNIATSGADYLRVVCTKGAMALPSGQVWRGAQTAAPTWHDPLQMTPGTPALCPDPLIEQITRLARHMDTGAETGLCTGAQGLSALEMTLACAYAGQTGHPVARGGVPGTYAGGAIPPPKVAQSHISA